MPETKKKLYDAEGREISPASIVNPEPPAKKFFDLQGNPLGIGLPQISDTKAGEKFQEGTKEGAPYVARLGANSLPMAASFAPGPYKIPAVLASTLAKNLLRNSWPEVFGEPIKGFPDIAVEVGMDQLSNVAIPAGIDKIGSLIAGRELANFPMAFRQFPAVREGAAKEMTRQILGQFERPETEILGEAANEAGVRQRMMQGQVKRAMMRETPTDVLEEGPPLNVGPYRLRRENLIQEVGMNPDNPPPRSSTEKAFETYENRLGSNQLGRKLVQLDKEIKAGVDIAKSQTYKEIANNALSDITRVQNWKLAAGPEGIQDLAINKLLTGGFKAADERLNATAILNELGGKNREIYKEAIDPAVYNEFENLIKEIRLQEVGHTVPDALVKWSKGKLVWTAIGATTFLHGLGSGALAGGAAGGIYLTNKLLARAMENPATAQAVVQAMRTSAKAPEAGMINQILQGVFKGASDLATVPDK